MRTASDFIEPPLKLIPAVDITALPALLQKRF
jgi:hypothetical protein